MDRENDSKSMEVGYVWTQIFLSPKKVAARTSDRELLSVLAILIIFGGALNLV